MRQKCLEVIAALTRTSQRQIYKQNITNQTFNVKKVMKPTNYNRVQKPQATAINKKVRKASSVGNLADMYLSYYHLALSSRMATRRILPFTVFGNSATNSTTLGYLYGAVLLFTKV